MKTIEQVYMPRTANFQAWIDKSKTTLSEWCVPFPSKRITGRFYNIFIDMETYLMRCMCPAFAGGFDEQGRVIPALGICSHVKKLQWVCELKDNPNWVSLEARLSISDEWIDASMKRILDLMAEKPMTCDECEVVTGLIHQTCSPIILRLVKAGWLEPSGDRRKTRRGRSAIVWQVT